MGSGPVPRVGIRLIWAETKALEGRGPAEAVLNLAAFRETGATPRSFTGIATSYQSVV